MKLLRSAFILAFLLYGGLVFSQPLLTSKNMSLGGGGIAYLTGFEANFVNPANLMIRSRQVDLHFGLGGGAFFYNPVLPANSLKQQFENFSDNFKSYQLGSTVLVSGDRNNILARNYKNDRLVSEHQQRFDILFGGVKWQQGNKAFSISARSRISNRIEIGRGWYDDLFHEQDSTSVRNMLLVQQSQSLYEFSFGYAQNFVFVSGLIPRLSNIYIGIAPKFVIGGSHMNLNYDAKYVLGPEQNQPYFIESFNYNSSGKFTQATETYRIANNVSTANRNLSSLFYTKPTGYGVGFDFGLTYVLSLGDDMSMASINEKVLQKSLRLGFSVTDIGFIRYDKNPLFIQNEPDTLLSFPSDIARSRFEGVSGQYISFFDDADSSLNPLTGSPGENQMQRNSFSTTLPTSFNAGMLLEINRIEFAADLTLGLNDTAFSNTKLTGHFGIEFNPLKPVPIRLGTRVAAGSPTIWSMGTGIEMKHWEFSLSTRFSTQSTAYNSEFNGAAFGGLKFHF